MNTSCCNASSDDQARQDELEAQANGLLREHSQRYVATEYPFYASSSLRQIARREERLASRELRPGAPQPGRAMVVLDALCEQVELGEVNRVLLDLARMGLTAAEIAEELELSVKAVHNRMSRILRRLRRLVQSRDGGPEQIAATYQEQAESERYHPEQHCDPGREACRKDGRCKFRWYLYHVTSEQKAE